MEHHLNEASILVKMCVTHLINLEGRDNPGHIPSNIRPVAIVTYIHLEMFLQTHIHLSNFAIFVILVG